MSEKPALTKTQVWGSVFEAGYEEYFEGEGAESEAQCRKVAPTLWPHPGLACGHCNLQNSGAFGVTSNLLMHLLCDRG